MLHGGILFVRDNFTGAVGNDKSEDAHEAHSSRGTKRRRDGEQIITKQTPHMKRPTNKQIGTATEVPPWNGQLKNY